MPKHPILSRETFFSRIPGSNFGGANAPHQLKRVEWNLVQTELGYMVEPMQDPGPDPTSKTQDNDAYDMSFNAVRVIDSDGMIQNDFGTGGSCNPWDYSLTPA